MAKKYNVIEVVEASAVSGNTIFPKDTVITFYNDTSKIKIADGKTPFNSLPAIGGGSGGITPEIQAALDLKAPLANPAFTGTVTGITAAMVGLGSVNNTSDAAKPVSTAQATAIGLKANSASPTFTGTVVLPATTSIGTITNTELSYVDGVTSSIQTQLNGKSDINIVINTPVANYTLVLADNTKLINMNVAGANTLTIPLNATVAFPIGANIMVSQLGAGQVTITPIGGVTLNSAGGKLKTNVQFSTATLIKTGTDVWLVSGDLAV